MTTIGDSIAGAALVLAKAGIEDPRHDARLLVGLALKMTPTQVFNATNDPLPELAKDNILRIVSRRAKGEPVAHITGEREFWSLPFEVSSATLIPRPDSETLIELILDQHADRPPRRILDLGTGSGCLLLSLLSEYKSATGVGIDMSPDALNVAIRNAKRIGLESRSRFAVGSWMDGLSETFDLVISNPPYIPTDDICDLDSDVRAFEPISALDGGKDGLDMYRAIFAGLDHVLAPDGRAVVEIGISQRNGVSQIASDFGFGLVQTRDDIGGITRALMFDKKSVGIARGKR